MEGRLVTDPDEGSEPQGKHALRSEVVSWPEEDVDPLPEGPLPE